MLQKMTRSILLDMIVGIDEKLVVGLDLNKRYLLKNSVANQFYVTLIDANHCPGAVMFLFEGRFGRILATGDFRYTPKMFENTCLSNTSLDRCYLDTTYLHPIYSNIPSRKNAMNEMIDLIYICLQKYGRHRVIFEILLKNLGKEEILSMFNCQFIF